MGNNISQSAKKPHNFTTNDIPSFAEQNFDSFWGKFDARNVKVTECSGLSGSKTFRVEAADKSPPVIALHCRSASHVRDTLGEKRLAAAAKLFADHKLSPPRIAEGAGWFVDVWEGQHLSFHTADYAIRLGHLLSSIHKLPVDWFSEWRKLRSEEVPILKKVSDGNPVWWFAAEGGFPDRLSHRDEEFLLTLINFHDDIPWTSTATRLVTVHGDFHKQNILANGDKLICIDLDESGVMMAGYDLAFGSFLACKDDATRRVFLRTYLEDMGDPCTPLDVENLLFDMHLCFFITHAGEGSLYKARNWSLRRRVRFQAAVKEVVDRAKESAELRAAVIARGLMVVCEEESSELASIRSSKSRIGNGVTVATKSKEQGEGRRFVINWDGTIQPLDDVWRGLVLGVSQRHPNAIVLTPYSSESNRLHVRMSGNVPTTGLPAPSGPRVRLLARVRGPDVTSLIGWGTKEMDKEHPIALGLVGEGHFKGFKYEQIGVVSAKEAVHVHFEGDGYIRLADRPYKMLDCAGASYHEGNGVNFWFGFRGDNQKFVLNANGTVSPTRAPGVVLGLKEPDSRSIKLVNAASERVRSM